MKICHYIHPQNPFKESRLGILIKGHTVIDPNLCFALDFQREGWFNPFERAHYYMPTKLSQLLTFNIKPIERLTEAYSLYLFFKKLGIDQLKNGLSIHFNLKSDQLILDKPLDKITNYRDFYTHEGHVQKSFKKRNEKIPPYWYEKPVYYKGTTEGFIGPDQTVLWPHYTDKLDYELELAAIIQKDGKNIQKHESFQYIFGLTILNDISARDIQKKRNVCSSWPL